MTIAVCPPCGRRHRPVVAVLLHGTVIMHKNAAGLSREKIVRQVVEQEESVRDFWSYIPIGNAPQKLQQWISQGAKVHYVSALTENKKARGDEFVGREGLKADEIVLERYGFPKSTIYHREPGENHQDVIERMLPRPDILIEDDCESIGGETEMAYPKVRPELKEKITSIVVKEFGGIDHLPDDIETLRNA